MRGWRIFRILGIDITVDLSWFLILALMVYTLGFIEFPRELHPRAIRARADWISITLGVTTSVLLFASVLAHELSHSWMAIQRGIPVKRITLFIFGGVAQIAGEPDKPLSEFLIAIMGPLMSVALAAVFGAAWLWMQIIDANDWLGISLAPLILLTGLLAQANGSLALFNLAPGFPLDGGRVLRALLWGWWQNIRTATLWASRAGQAIAILLIAFGVVPILLDWVGISFDFLPANLGNLWFVLIGSFLWNAATDGYRQTLLTDSLRQVSVRQLLTPVASPVSPELTLTDFIDAYLLHYHDQIFLVAGENDAQGIIGSAQVRPVPRAEWRTCRIREVMMPLNQIPTVNPDESAARALMQLNSTESGVLAVIENSQVIGFIGHGELTRYLKLHGD